MQTHAPAVAGVALRDGGVPRRLIAALAALALLASSTALAQGAASNSSIHAIKTAASPASISGGGGDGGSTPFQTAYFEPGNLIRAGETIAALGPDLLGDKVNEYNGALEFDQTYAGLPGNNALPVMVGRHLRAGSGQAGRVNGHSGDWELAIPHLRTLAGARPGDTWTGLAPDAVTRTLQRCSQFALPKKDSMHGWTLVVTFQQRPPCSPRFVELQYSGSGH